MVARKQFPQFVASSSGQPKSRTAAIMALGGYTSSARLKRILAVLDRCFANAHCALVYRTPFELLVATILSAQCTDKRVNQITPALFQRYPTPKDFASLPTEALERDIYSTGFFRSKAKNITAASKQIVKDFNGKVPRTMEALMSLPGIARKSANVILSSAYGIPSVIVIDTHVFRVATRRLRLSEG